MKPARAKRPKHGGGPARRIRSTRICSLREYGRTACGNFARRCWFERLWNLQSILPSGDKRFRPGRAGSLFAPIGDLMNPALLLICEGWATAKETGARLLVPEFPEGAAGTDFNDLANLRRAAR